MRRLIVLGAGLAVASLALADGLTLADVKAKSGTQVSPEDAQQLLPGAKIVSRTNTGSTRTWENKPDGTFIVSTDNRGNPGIHGASTARGTWRVGDKGTFCVTIDWPRTEEKWCRYLFKTGDKYYGVGKLDDTATAFELEIAK